MRPRGWPRVGGGRGGERGDWGAEVRGRASIKLLGTDFRVHPQED